MRRYTIVVYEDGQELDAERFDQYEMDSLVELAKMDIGMAASPMMEAESRALYAKLRRLAGMEGGRDDE